MTTTTTTTDTTTTIDPGRAYSPAGLAKAIGRSDRYVYDLCREKLLRHSRTRPPEPDGKPRGPITIMGSAWLEYLKRCEVGGAGEGESEGAEEDGEHSAATPARSRRRAQRSPATATPKNPWLAYKAGEAGRATG